MRKAFGFLVVLWGLSVFFNTAFPALDSAAREAFKTLEVAATVAQKKFENQ